MTAPAIPPRPPAISWQHVLASPFVRDTLLPALGGPSPAFVGTDNSWIAPQARARTVGDTVRFYHDDGNVRTVAHELGHVLDNRGDAAATLTKVLESAANPGSYAAETPGEHKAEAFAEAMMSARRGFADSTAANRNVPGAIDVIRWLQTRPPFAPSFSHPLVTPAQ